MKLCSRIGESRGGFDYRATYHSGKQPEFTHDLADPGQGFGWKRWSSRWLHEQLGLYNEYKVRWRPTTKASHVGRTSSVSGNHRQEIEHELSQYGAV